MFIFYYKSAQLICVYLRKVIKNVILLLYVRLEEGESEERGGFCDV